MHYFYWAHNLPIPKDMTSHLFVRIIWGESRQVWDQYYPDETWRSWIFWEIPYVVGVFLSLPFLIVGILVLSVLLWLTEQVCA